MITIPFSLPTTYVLITPAILKNLIGHLMGLVVKVTSRPHYTARNVQVSASLVQVCYLAVINPTSGILLRHDNNESAVSCQQT